MLSPITAPAADGYRMPAEWEEHSRTWMLWPFRPDVWRENARPAQAAFAAVAAAIARFEPVRVGALPELVEAARGLLPPAVEVVAVAYNDAWVRDSGPTFLVDGPAPGFRPFDKFRPPQAQPTGAGGLAGVDWIFNAWGGHYANFSADDALAGHILGCVGARRYRADLVMEGGALHVDGEGTLLVVEECLLHRNRNPHLSKGEIEARLKDYLNVQTVIWLPYGVVNDETAGHVDNLACFVRPGFVALTWTDDAHDPQHARSLAAEHTLLASRDAQGRRLEVHRIHQPGPLFMTDGEASTILPAPGSRPRFGGARLAGSYINHYIVNRGVIVPVFDDPHDAPALAKLAELYPNREIVPVPGREILLGGGNVHCITQQQPKG
ncbi:MAG: agmatine deiminase [Chloroflexi bacterium]|nr:agmatine deiminase [Chloroflexota bacterium]